MIVPGEHNRLGGWRTRRGRRRPRRLRASPTRRRTEGQSSRRPETSVPLRVRLRQADAALQARQGDLPDSKYHIIYVTNVAFIDGLVDGLY